MKKVITISWVVDAYSTGRIIKTIEDYADEDYKFIHCVEALLPGQQSRENVYLISGIMNLRFSIRWAKLTGNPYGCGNMATRRLCRFIASQKPDIVHIHCPNSRSVNLYKLLNFLEKLRCKIVITNHAEFFITGNCAHADECEGYMTGCYNCPDYHKSTGAWFINRTHRNWQLMKDCMSDASIRMVAVSPWSQKRIEESTIGKGKKVSVIKNGIDTSVFTYQHITDGLSFLNRSEVREDYIHVTSNFSDDINDIKGGSYIIELARKLPELMFVVVGPNYCVGSMPDNIILLGSINDMELLAKCYSAARALIMVSKKETFGLTCAEALCCGTPVIGFKNGGSESIAIEKYSSFVEFGHIEELKDKLLAFEYSKVDKQRLSEEAAAEYSNESMAGQYIELYQEVLNE